MHVLSVLGIRIGQKVRLDALVDRPPGPAVINGLERATVRRNHVHMPRIARVYDHRTEYRAVRRALTQRIPLEVHLMIVVAIDAAPRDASILTAKQRRRRRPCVPHVMIVAVPWR